MGKLLYPTEKDSFYIFRRYVIQVLEVYLFDKYKNR